MSDEFNMSMRKFLKQVGVLPRSRPSKKQCALQTTLQANIL